ncbi:penicillin-binding protein 2 [Parachitinimonas caeni]|uniref:Peptidoglycan D,D-transpeptidase MrdA n=1 Tax=Parachitinimonas caeni TaxID=3031301 RepID=A0ABT7E0V1_9NEIS|nr:penicillin-binding protein 2 [Parachitinimonas caeni]MDK2124958.1 penicillin-binding protein 2 [Parachitinimonas caeni]
MKLRTELRNREREQYDFQWRLLAALLFVITLFCTLVARFVYLQVIEHQHYQTMAETNRISLVPIPPSRGIITDRNGVVLAHNYSAYTLEITPSKLENIESTINALSEIVEITAKDRRRFKKLADESKDFESLPIRTRLTEVEIAKFAAQSFRFPGVEIKARLFRHYPMGQSASHLIGYIGRINDKDLDTLEQDGRLPNYKGTNHMGKFGLEQSYEAYLHGKTGYEEVETDAGGRAIRSLRQVPATAGNNLRLTIDIQLQQLAEKAFGDNKGALIAIDPATGGVLALVSRPGFDPNLFVDGIDPQSWKELNESPDRPLNNRAIQGTYAPGSTFKPFMAMVALETGKRTAQQGMHDPGFFVLGTHRWNDDKRGGHGWVNMYQSIVQSCDTYYYQLAMDLGIDNISRYMAQFGFGQKSGIDLPGEKIGVLPSQDWKRRAFRKPEAGKWFVGDTISIGIGQGFNTYTPMQLAHATSILANNGVIFRPHLVGFIEDSATGTQTKVEPKPIAQLPFKPANFDIVKAAMVGVNKEGTAARVFRNSEYVSAGKTGTAQVFSLKGEKYNASRISKQLHDNAWFIAFAPAEKPKIALALIVENGGFGAQAAAPIAKIVMDYYLLGKQPTEVVQIHPGSNNAEPQTDGEEVLVD